MDKVMEKMIRCQPGQQFITEEGAKVASYIHYTRESRGYSPYELESIKLRLMGLHMTVLSWMGETRNYSFGESDAYLADFLSVIGEKGEYELDERYGIKTVIRIFWRENDSEALLVWGTPSYITQMGFAYGQGGMRAAQLKDREVI